MSAIGGVAPVRRAAFAGSWYPADPTELTAAIAAALPPEGAPTPALGVIAPHAGYRFSLRIAAETYARVVVPRTALVLCPNHRVPPPIVSVWPGGVWETPCGPVPVDEALVARILDECPGVVAETGAHLREHAVELHLPILRHLQPALRVVGMVVAISRPEALRALGEGLARAIGERDDVLLVASTDMTHFEPEAVAAAQDARALARVEALDDAGLLEVCEREEITMCGVRPTAAVIAACRARGATRVERVRYGSSADAGGDRESVVGYAGLVIR